MTHGYRSLRWLRTRDSDRPQELGVQLGANHTRGGVAHPDRVGARLDLRRGVADGDLGREVKQASHEYGVVNEIHHDVIQTT